jgi:hypothetical protein
MKNLIIYILIINLMSCGINSNAELLDGKEIVKFGELSNVEKDKTVTYEKGITVEIIEIFDSRCPINAVCVWEGEAKVVFQINTDTFSLLMEESKEFSFNGDSFKLEFKNIAPFPTTENGNEIKKAVFTIVEL